MEVHLLVDIEEETSYRIVDYLPSGLQAITRSYSSWFSSWSAGYRSPYHQSNQELSFYVYCHEDENCNQVEIYYLARVINPGTFKAEPALLQEFSALDLTNISDEVEIVIEP